MLVAETSQAQIIHRPFTAQINMEARRLHGRYCSCFIGGPLHVGLEECGAKSGMAFIGSGGWVSAEGTKFCVFVRA